MIEDRATEILSESIRTQCESSIKQLARNVVKKFNDGPRPKERSIIKLNLEVELHADLLYEIEEYLATQANGKKKFRKNFYKRRG